MSQTIFLGTLLRTKDMVRVCRSKNRPRWAKGKFQSCLHWKIFIYFFPFFFVLESAANSVAGTGSEEQTCPIAGFRILGTQIPFSFHFLPASSGNRIWVSRSTTERRYHRSWGSVVDWKSDIPMLEWKKEKVMIQV